MKLLLLLLGLSAAVYGGDYYGEHIGEITLIHHDVTGQVYIVDDKRIRIRHFYYDGKGPDAFFYMATRQAALDEPSAAGTIMLDQYGRTSILDAYVNADVVLTLPDDVTVNDVEWLYVWCRQAGANFGHLRFPASDSFHVPAPIIVGQFAAGGHGVKSGNITVLDKRTITVENFHYDGVAPDTFFWAGNGSTPDENGHVVPNSDSGMMKLSGYDGQTVTLNLPYDMTIDDIGYLSVYCKSAKESFGHIVIEKNLMVPPYTMHIEEYYGKLVGDLTTEAHDVEGTVYLIDNMRIRIRNFFYDGLGPDAHVYMGMTDKPSGNGTSLEVVGALSSVLGKFENGDITVRLPSGKSFSDYRWLSIWCVSVGVNFGHIFIPEAFKFNPPTPRELLPFSQKAHGVRSGKVTILDTRTIVIEDFHYDGRGPDAFFYVGTGNNPSTQTGMKIPDETGSLAKAKGYEGETITLTLPEGLTFFDIDWLSLYCIGAKENFGHVMIPDDLNVPAYNLELEAQVENCEKMHDFFNVGWQIDGDYINFEFTGALEEDGYMAFGLSGLDGSSSMYNGDVIVVSYQDSAPQVRDFLLNAYSQCSGSDGVCTDEEQGGVNDVEGVQGYQMDSITTVKFGRKLNTGDSKDKVYSTSSEMYVIWAMGLLTGESVVTKHNLRLEGNKQIHFGREASRNCPPVVSRIPPETMDPWKIPKLYGTDGVEFEVCIGSAGPQEHGYTAITGTASWGIAWYVNGWLIPEIVVERGHEYTFRVSGGDDPNIPAQYHPFYITDDPAGGYEAKDNEAENDEFTIFAGPQEGRYCEFKESAVSDENTDTFKEYNETLIKECAAGEEGTLYWMPDSLTPDTVYYHCYTHKYLGYKITVVDNIMVAGAPRVCPYVHILTAVVMVIVAVICAM